MTRQHQISQPSNSFHRTALFMAVFLFIATLFAFGSFAGGSEKGEGDRLPWKPWSAEGRTVHV